MEILRCPEGLVSRRLSGVLEHEKIKKPSGVLEEGGILVNGTVPRARAHSMENVTHFKSVGGNNGLFNKWFSDI